MGFQAEKKSKWNSTIESDGRTYNYREVLETFFPKSLVAAIQYDIDNRNITDICKQIAMFGEIPFPLEQEEKVSQIIHGYLDDLGRKPEERHFMTAIRKTILDRYVINAFENTLKENPDFVSQIVFERANVPAQKK